MEQQILNRIIANTFTIHQLHRRLRILKDFLVNKLFTENSKPLEEITKDDTEWLNSFEPEFLNLFNTDNIYQIFEQAEKTASTLPVLVVYIPFDINPTQTTELGIWLKENFGKNMLYETRFDPNLIGSCALVWNGIYKDYSLRKKIEESRDTILMSNLKSFLR